MTTLYLIPIRKGSKGVPGKNMKMLGSKPLVAWILDSILASRTADEIWVATDDEAAERFISDNYPQVSIFRRSAASAADDSLVIDVVLEFIAAEAPAEESMLVLAQATSPFTQPDEFKLLQQQFSPDYDSYISCTRVKKFVWSEDGKPLCYDLATKPRRQDYPGILTETGAFYASRIKNIIKSRQLLSGRIRVVESVNDNNIDIDTPTDWLIAEAIVKKQSNNPLVIIHNLK